MKEALLLVFANKQDIPGGKPAQTALPTLPIPSQSLSLSLSHPPPLPILTPSSQPQLTPPNPPGTSPNQSEGSPPTNPPLSSHAAMRPSEVQERLKLDQLKDKLWYVVPSCATTGEGLFEGLVRPPPPPLSHK